MATEGKSLDLDSYEVCEEKSLDKNTVCEEKPLDKNEDEFDPTEFLEALKLFDIHGTGVIYTSELGDMMRSHGQNPTPEELLELIEKVHAKDRKDIDFPEFLTIMAERIFDEKTMKDLATAYDVFDKNCNGYLSLKELEDVINNLGEKLSKEEIAKKLKDGDINKDGKITFEGFKLAILS